MEYYGMTDPGMMRKNNQDAFIATWISYMGNNAMLLAVIDGVGGYAGGDIAAAITREAVKKYMDGCMVPSPEICLEQSLIIANNKITSKALSNASVGMMGCVASACIVLPDKRMFYAHVGDTRIYVYDGEKLRKVTHDHSIVGELEDCGFLTEEQAIVHPQRSIITRMLGETIHRLGDGFVEIGLIILPDKYQILLCSDGLTDQLRLKSICAIMKDIMPLEEKVKTLVEAANCAGGRDNVTVVIAENR